VPEPASGWDQKRVAHLAVACLLHPTVDADQVRAPSPGAVVEQAVEVKLPALLRVHRQAHLDAGQ